MTNWRTVAATDKRLRAEVDNASEALAHHRYDNTIGAGIAFREYAKQCGVTLEAVRSYARAWEVTISDSRLSISDALVRASTSDDRFDVISELAKAQNVTPKAIQAHHTDEIRRVESIARERSTKCGTTIREEAHRLAETAQRQRAAERNRQAARREKLDLRYLELERYLQAARRALVNAAACDFEIGDEHRELIAEAIAVVRRLVDLIDTRFVGATNVDWDAELAKITGEVE